MDGRFMALRVGFHSPLLQLAGLNFLSPALQKVAFTFINISACFFLTTVNGLDIWFDFRVGGILIFTARSPERVSRHDFEVLKA